MSAKKKEKPEWKLCAACQCSFPRSVCVKHEKKCQVVEHSPDNTTPAEEATDSGFIKDGVLHGICKYIDRNSPLLPTTKNDLVVVHPSAIKLCNFQITSSVLVKYGGRQTCGMIWPSTAIPVDGVGLKSTKMKTLHVSNVDIVIVEILLCPWVIADKVVLEPQIDLARKHFTTVLPIMLLELEDAIIMQGDFVSIPHYGEELLYIVKEVIGDSTMGNMTESKQVCDTSKDVLKDVQEISKGFQLLFVNGNSDSGCYPEVSSPAINVFVYNVMIHATSLVLSNPIQEPSGLSGHLETPTAFNMIGGLDSQIKLLKELIELPFTLPSLFSKCGIVLSKGIIVHGVSGTGKTTLVHEFVKSLPQVHTATINGPELSSKFQGETEQKLRDIFLKTKARSPSLLIIDEFDAICPTRTSSSSESEKRVVATLLTLLDDVQKDDLFAVIAITSKLELIDMALRRPGRFDREIEIGVPNVRERWDVLKTFIQGWKHSLTDGEIEELSEVTHGYVGADLSALVKEAGMIAMRGIMGDNQEYFSSENMGNVDCDHLVQCFSVTMDNFRSALSEVRPSAMKAVMVDIPKVFWRDVGGQDNVKQKMKEAIEWPLKHPDVFKRLGIAPPRGLLMYGPPGCSKTLIAKALATESSLNFISIKGPELFNKYLGESERAIRDVFHKARISAPSIVFFDEIDALGVQRSSKDSGSNNVADRVLAQLLTELDGVESLDGVIIIAATNRPDIIDTALLRPGRIDRLVYVPLPNENTRKEIFEIQFRSIPVSEDVELDQLVVMSANYSGAEICSLCREAAMIALREDFQCKQVSLRHFQIIFEQIKPGTSEESLNMYDNFRRKTTGSF